MSYVEPVGMVVLDLANEEEAIRLAYKIARRMGRAVTVRDSEMEIIETIPAPATH